MRGLQSQQARALSLRGLLGTVRTPQAEQQAHAPANLQSFQTVLVKANYTF